MTAPRRPQLLMVEPSAMIRNLVVQVARELRVAEFHQTGLWPTAQQLLNAHRMDGLILSTDDASRACALLTLLRQGQLHTPADIPVIALLPATAQGARQALEALGVEHYLHTPFRIRDIFETLGCLWPSSPTLPALKQPSNAAKLR